METTSRPLLKLAIEIGPLLAFFLANAKLGIFWATGIFMAAMVVSVGATYKLERRLPKLPLVTGVFVLVFGSLTLILQDELFIKVKPTIVNGLFAAILVGGMLFGKNFLKSVMGGMLPITDEGWRLLAWRWAIFFVLLAVLNEYVWRNYSTDQWVSFKVFGIMPLTLAFSLLQLPLLQRFKQPEEPR
ncbi:MAG: septation protein A [Alphaproteobacteria bacterium]